MIGTSHEEEGVNSSFSEATDDDQLVGDEDSDEGDDVEMMEV